MANELAESILRKMLAVSTPTFGPDDWLVLDAAIRVTDEERVYLADLSPRDGDPCPRCRRPMFVVPKTEGTYGCDCLPE